METPGGSMRGGRDKPVGRWRARNRIGRCKLLPDKQWYRNKLCHYGGRGMSPPGARPRRGFTVESGRAAPYNQALDSEPDLPVAYHTHLDNVSGSRLGPIV